MKHAPLLLILLLVSCNVIQGRKDIPEPRLQTVYLALLDYTERSPTAMPDSIRRAHTDSIFRANDISEPDFRQAMQEYTNNPDKWREFTRKLISLKEEKAKPKKVEKPSAGAK
jgi:hypothetical protein